MKKDKEVLYIKIEHNPAVKLEKDILASEVGILNLLRIIRAYHESKNKEISLRLKAQKKMKDLQDSLTKLEGLLPEVKEVEINKEEIYKKPEKKTTSSKKQFSEKDEIQRQLQDIQDKLQILDTPNY